MPGFWRVTAIYGLGMGLTDAVMLLLSDLSFRSGAAVFYTLCLVAALALPALVAGMGFARHLRRAPGAPEAWRFALWFAALQGGLMAFLLWLAMQELLAEEPDGAAILGVILVGYSAVALLLSRFFFALGAREGMRRSVPR